MDLGQWSIPQGASFFFLFLPQPAPILQRGHSSLTSRVLIVEWLLLQSKTKGAQNQEGHLLRRLLRTCTLTVREATSPKYLFHP